MFCVSFLGLQNLKKKEREKLDQIAKVLRELSIRLLSLTRRWCDLTRPQTRCSVSKRDSGLLLTVIVGRCGKPKNAVAVEADLKNMRLLNRYQNNICAIKLLYLECLWSKMFQ